MPGLYAEQNDTHVLSLFDCHRLQRPDGRRAPEAFPSASRRGNRERVVFMDHLPLLADLSQDESAPRSPSNWLPRFSIEGFEAIGSIKYSEPAMSLKAAVLS